MKKFRKGDVVSVEGVASGSGFSGKMEISIPDGSGFYETINVTADVIKFLKAAPPQPGEIVIIDDNEAETHEVLAVHDDQAWLKKLSSGMLWLGPVSRLVVVERA